MDGEESYQRSVNEIGLVTSYEGGFRDFQETNRSKLSIAS